MSKVERAQSPKEEIANGFSHAVGILFSLIALPLLLKKVDYQSNLIEFYSIVIFGIGMLMVYISSTVYHLTVEAKLKYRWKVADHISIYYLIAGTYTPVVLKYIDQDLAIKFLSIMWSIVLIGSVLKLFFTNRFELISVLLYLVLGWMLVFILKPLLASIPQPIFHWIVAGGLSYTIGVYFYVKGYKMYYHLVWHLFVLLGTVLHFMAVWKGV
jgi:hemolysin III